MAQMPGEGWDALGRSCRERRFCLGEAWRLQIRGLLAVFERATATVLGRKFFVGR